MEVTNDPVRAFVPGEMNPTGNISNKMQVTAIRVKIEQIYHGNIRVFIGQLRILKKLEQRNTLGDIKMRRE